MDGESLQGFLGDMGEFWEKGSPREGRQAQWMREDWVEFGAQRARPVAGVQRLPVALKESRRGLECGVCTATV